MDLASRVAIGMEKDTIFCVAEATIPSGCSLPAFFEKAQGHFVRVVVNKGTRDVIKLLRFRNEPAPWQGFKGEIGGLDEVQST